MNQHHGTVVIGGSQAGLAVGYHLKQRGLPFVILDEHERIGDAWRKRWDSLRLFTPGRYDSLPGMRFPGSSSSYPTKDEIADYLEAYARAFELPVRTGVKSRQSVKGRRSIRRDLRQRHALLRERRRGNGRLSPPQDPAVRRVSSTSASFSFTPRTTGTRPRFRKAACWSSAPATPEPRLRSSSLLITRRGYRAATRARSRHAPGLFPINWSRRSCGSWRPRC